jgi:hypothetical protein
MKLVWDTTGERKYEMGVDHGVLYPQNNTGAYQSGVAWNGLTNVTESPEGAEATDLWADNIKYGSLRSAETFGGTIEAYTYPEEFNQCDGNVEVAPGVYIGQQSRVPFGFSYRTMIGSDAGSDSDDSYKLHLVYGATASPSEKSRDTINDSPEAATLSWEFDTTPVNVTGHKATAKMEIDSTKTTPDKMEKIENILYGGEPTVTDSEPGDWETNYKNYYEKVGNEYVPVTGVSAPSWVASKYYSAGDPPRLPLPDEVITLLSEE